MPNSNSERQLMGEEVQVFTRRLGEMIEEGLPLVKIFSTLVQQQEDFKQILAGVQLEVLRGNSISRAMAQHPEVFNKEYIAAVKHGEQTGTLDEALKNLSEKL